MLVELAGPVRLSSIIVATYSLHLARRTKVGELDEDHSSQSWLTQSFLEKTQQRYQGSALTLLGFVSWSDLPQYRRQDLVLGLHETIFLDLAGQRILQDDDLALEFSWLWTLPQTGLRTSALADHLQIVLRGSIWQHLVPFGFLLPILRLLVALRSCRLWCLSLHMSGSKLQSAIPVHTSFHVVRRSDLDPRKYLATHRCFGSQCFSPLLLPIRDVSG